MAVYSSLELHTDHTFFDSKHTGIKPEDLEIVRRTDVEEVIENKEVTSLWVKLFQGFGNYIKTGEVERAEGQHFPQGKGARIYFQQGGEGKESEERLRMQGILLLKYK